jgi:hypothetical protein
MLTVRMAITTKEYEMSQVPAQPPKNTEAVQDDNRGGDRELTEEQQNFARVVGELLAARWASMQASASGKP